MTKKQVITIFMASPSDLREERAVFRDLVLSLNKDYSLALKNTFEFKAVGYEDSIQPHPHRAQGNINELIDQTNIFLLVLHCRWGQAYDQAATGCTSYSDEEFMYAKKIKEANGGRLPIIYVFFKHDDLSRSKTPDKQLEQVLNFKATLRNNFTYFSDLQDFRVKLLGHIHDAVGKHFDGPQSAAPIPDHTTRPASRFHRAALIGVAAIAILLFVKTYSGGANAGDPGAGTNAASPANDDLKKLVDEIQAVIKTTTPGSAEYCNYMNRLGLLYFEHKKLDDSEKVFNQLVATSPEQPHWTAVANFELGNIGNERRAKATSDAERAKLKNFTRSHWEAARDLYRGIAEKTNDAAAAQDAKQMSINIDRLNSEP